MKFRQFSLNSSVDSKALFKLLHHFAYEEGTCLLYSGGSYETAKHSYLFLFPFDYIEIRAGAQQRCRLGSPPLFSSEANPWQALSILGKEIGQGKHSFPDWVGFFGYEMGAFSDQDLIIPHFLSDTPQAYLQRCAITLAIDHKTGKGFVQVLDQEYHLFNEHWKRWLLCLSTPSGWEQVLASELGEGLSNKLRNSKLILRSTSETEESYKNKIKQAKELIKTGDIYQINLSQQWEFLGKRDPFDLFKNLALLNPSPFSAYLYLKDFSIISSSPERFLQKKEGLVETRPIKGTAPRGKTKAQDLDRKQGLLTSEKELAELMMITDLMRNDLGKISVNGSIEVPLLCECEAYSNVFHLYSVVRSRVLQTLHPIEIVRACFPAGSITGCPKLRAMEVIAELEQRPRGIYTGAIGYFSQNGDFDFNVAIRTLIATEGKINVQLGAGIVIDSDPQREYEEIHHKGRSIFEVLNTL